MLPRAVIRSTPEDFVVEEIPAYEPTGVGEHLFVRFRKRGLTTFAAVKTIAAALGARESDAGFAGMKDRHAVTTQTASFPLPAAVDPAPLLAPLASAELEILAATRHGHKLRTGQLRGNRFTLTLREIDDAAAASIGASLDAIAARGVPNAFGPQRFGRDGDNPERALAWLAGGPGPRAKKEQRLLFSSLQSLLFNRVLERRVADGSWSRVLAGDVAKKTDTGGLFTVPAEPEALADAERRAAEGLLGATGPIFGAKMRWPEGRPAEIERAVLAEALGANDAEALLLRFKRLGEGSRRPLVLRATELTWRREAAGAWLVVRFVLPKGGYATTVLAAACQPVAVNG